MPLPSNSLKPFVYLNADKAPLYRALMGLFVEAKAHFEIHLRPFEIADRLRLIAEANVGPATEIEGALTQLCEWGNLKRTQDTSDVRTVEEFYRPRYLYQLTREGEAAERAVRSYEENISRPGELQTAALGVIREQLQVLLAYTQNPEFDARKIHLTLTTLKNYFEQLTTKAQVFIGSIQRAIDLHGYELEVFIAYKEKLIDYLERFIGELVLAAGEIAHIIQQLEQADIYSLLRLAAAHDLIDAVDAGPHALAQAEHEWLLRWTGLKRWFISGADTPSQADTLRRCARAAIPALLLAVSGFHDRRVASSDRPTDLKLLARWFAQTETEADAHRLWRTAFGLNPARHLRIDEETLAARDQQPIAATTSWLKAPPMLISPRLRRTGQQHRKGRPANVIDRTTEKRRLEALARQEAEQLEAARRRLVAPDTRRLSQLGELSRNEFQLLLDLLGKALAGQRDPAASVVASSSDGALEITLCPTNDGATATLVTTEGEFHGHDYFVRIVDLAGMNGSATDDGTAATPILTEPSLLTAGEREHE